MTAIAIAVLGVVAAVWLDGFTQFGNGMIVGAVEVGLLAIVVIWTARK